MTLLVILFMASHCLMLYPFKVLFHVSFHFIAVEFLTVKGTAGLPFHFLGSIALVLQEARSINGRRI